MSHNPSTRENTSETAGSLALSSIYSPDVKQAVDGRYLAASPRGCPLNAGAWGATDAEARTAWVEAIDRMEAALGNQCPQCEEARRHGPLLRCARHIDE